MVKFLIKTQGRRLLTVGKKKPREDMYFPIPQDCSLSQSKQLAEDSKLTKQIVRQTLQAAYRRQMPDTPGPWHSEYRKKPKPLVSDEEVLHVTSLLQSIQPSNAVESALAAQFVACHTYGMREFTRNSTKWALNLFEHSHKALDALQKYRNKGQQQINVQYNVNQGQVVNIKQMKDDIKPEIINVE